MKNLIGVLACLIIAKLLSSVMVDNLVIMFWVNYFALTIGYLGTLCFVAMFLCDENI